MDTVGVAGMERPFEPAVENGRLHGRGSYDMKAGLAAIMLAGAEAAGAGLSGDVIVTAVCDEEVASIGTARVAERYRPTRPSSRSRPRCGSSSPTRASSASRSRRRAAPRTARGPISASMRSRTWAPCSSASRSSTGGSAPTRPTRCSASGSLHASVIEGGQEFSSYPERCLLKGERRTIPGETAVHVEGELRELLGDIDGEIRLVMAREPFETPADAPIAELVARHAGGPEIVGAPFWADSALLSSAGIPTVVFGPAGEGAHAVEEWVDLVSAERCVEIYAAVARELCA